MHFAPLPARPPKLAIVVDLLPQRQIMAAMNRLLFMLLCGLLVAGCKNTPAGQHANSDAAAKRKGKSKVEMVPDDALRGRVAMVNPNSRTVILSFPLGWLPAVERRLNVYRGGVKVGEVKVTGPQMDTNIAADLLAGEARPGDQVRED